MEWKKISEKLPKAFSQFDRWMDKNNGLYWVRDGLGYYWADKHENSHRVFRDLYDFLDDQGIYVEIKFHENTDESIWWGWGIYKGEAVQFGDTSTRKEAEELAFLAALKMIEGVQA